jgi:hypothetical protein
MDRPTVNLRRALALLLVLAGCHTGRPPARTTPFQVGRVVAAAPEPGVGDALAKGLSNGLARHGALGAGPAIELRILDARDATEAADGAGRIHRVRLVVEATVPGAIPRRLVWEGARSYGASGLNPVASASDRAAAFGALAAQAGAEVANWVLFAPEPIREDAP